MTTQDAGASGSGSTSNEPTLELSAAALASDPFAKPEAEKPIIEINSTVDIRPDLSSLGIEETDKGVCEDTYENRAILRRAKMNWIPVYASNGIPTGLIMAVSPEMATEKRIMSISEKKPILENPDNKNSDYLTGLDLIAEEASDYLVPPWVIGATRAWIKEQDNPVKSPKRQPASLPKRCAAIKDDGIRCQLWTSGRLQDDGLCRVHLRSLKHRPGDDIERARQKLTQAAPYAVDMLEHMMETAESEPVKLKAATEILDRAGIRGGVELDTNVNIDVRPAASIIAERLNRLAINATDAAAKLSEMGISLTPSDVEAADPKIIDAEIVSEEDSPEDPGKE
jgi:hypothetical protein